MKVESINHLIRWNGSCLGKPSIEIKLGKSGKNQSIDEVLKKIRQVKACSRLVFSGMDPLLEQPELIRILSMIQDGWDVIIETSGGIMPDLDLRDKVTTWEIKVRKEGYSVPYNFNDDALRYFGTQKNSVFEFDVEGEQDMIQIKKIVYFYAVPWKRVLINPVVETDEIKRRLKWLYNFCIDKGCSMGNPIVNRRIKENVKDNDKRDPGLHNTAPKS